MPPGANREIGREEAIEMARQFPSGLFPPPTEDNPNPQWIGSLRDTISRLFRPTAATASTSSNAAEPDTPTPILRLRNVASAEELLDDATYEMILSRMTHGCAQYGSVVEIRLPRPTAVANAPGVGHATVRYETAEEAAIAADAFRGVYHVTYLTEAAFETADGHH